MELHFDTEEVARLYKHSKESKKRDLLYDQEGTDVPGLLIVGDHGVYLMSNGSENYPRPDGTEGSFVSYAKECNPDTMGDDWYDVKVEAFGGDDGGEYIEGKMIEQGLKLAKRENADFVIDLTPESIKVDGLPLDPGEEIAL